jgi:OOP family OmpA-OmpF porin
MSCAGDRKHTMTTISIWQLAALAGVGATLAAPAAAQDDSYWYGGLAVGQSEASIDQDRIRAGLTGLGLATTSFSTDEKDTAWRLFGGYQFNRYLGLEAGYFNLGKFGFGAGTQPAGTLNGQIKLQGLNLDLVGTLPLTERLALIGRVGAQYAQARDTFSGTGAVTVLDPNPRADDTQLKLGIGLQYAFSPSFLMRVEGERYRVNDAVGNLGDVSAVSLSLVFPFGRTPTPAPRMAAAPYVAPPVVAPPPPPPPPVVVVQAPPPPVMAAPQRRRVSFAADSLFGFDQSVVRPEGRAALDTFAREVQGTSFDVITVEGHTDRLGSTAYNQSLSQRRAEVVKAYLVGTGGVDAAKVSAVGRGESSPVTKPEDCKGERPTPRLVACLQPDRRVVVEVTGTR